jgi:hypothetical protein
MDQKWRAFVALFMDKIMKWGCVWGGTLLVLHIVAGFTS